MKKITFLTICAAMLASCSSNQNTSQSDSVATDSSATAPVRNATTGDVCFLHTDGTANQDSNLVHLKIDGNKVTGDMKWIPKEKDSRKGTLEGTQQGNTIKAL
ncbi:MAG: hypothetical protein ABIN95_00430, partial [Mucilaginibacter sp.]